MAASYSLNFQRPPSLWTLYPRIISARKPRLVPEGRTVPRIAAEWRGARIDAAHLAEYEALCGRGVAESLPIAYPHVLASALHLAILSSEKFPVALLGLVHVANRIEQRRPLARSERGSLVTWIDGHRETPRGQEFDLQTQWETDGAVAWSETSTFLARGPSRGERPAREDAATQPVATEPAGAERVTTSSFRAPAGLGRQYGWLAGDLNPIHLSDLTARAFGFRQAIAHGLWSMARCAAELAPSQPGSCVLDVQFRKPIYLPSWLMLQSRPEGSGWTFELRDSQGEQLHLTGSLVAG